MHAVRENRPNLQPHEQAPVIKVFLTYEEASKYAEKLHKEGRSVHVTSYQG